MAHSLYLFQPDPIDDVEFRPIRIDIHLGVEKIEQGEIYSDLDINNLTQTWLELQEKRSWQACNWHWLENMKGMERKGRKTFWSQAMREDKHWKDTEVDGKEIGFFIMGII